MKNLKFVISYSGGKDSMLSLYRMLKKGYKPAALLVTFDKNNNSWFHGIPKELFQKTAEALDIPLLEVNCPNGDDYSIEFSRALKNAKKLGIDLCVFGDIDIEAHKSWCLERCNEAGMMGEFPLWKEDREKLTNEFLEIGFSTVIKKVNLNLLNKEFLGLTLTKEIVNNIKEMGCDPSGENGEYHTFVFDGPIFKEKVNFRIIKKETSGDYGYLIIK
ncbi:diphthine--ammonia ligase [Clostridium sp. CTA-5]